MSRLILIVFSILFFASCVPQRKMVYVQPEEKGSGYTEYTTQGNFNLKIEPFDQLYVYVGSIDQPTHNFFELQAQKYNSLTDFTAAVISYTVNDSGYIMLPVVGKINLKGLKLVDAELKIQTACKDVISNPIVSVRFVNNTVTILGEVQRPGTYSYNKEQLSLFRAIGMAGDILEYGNRNKVTIIREKGKKIEKYYVDLTKESILTSSLYFIRPNDIIYVEPLKIRRFGMKEYPFALVVSALTSYIIVLSYLKK